MSVEDLQLDNLAVGPREQHHQVASETHVIGSRPSLIRQASSRMRNFSRISVTRARESLHQMGSFLGVTEADNTMELWKERFMDRAQRGDIGVHLSSIIPNRSRDLKNAIHELDTTLCEVTKRVKSIDINKAFNSTHQVDVDTSFVTETATCTQDINDTNEGSPEYELMTSTEEENHNDEIIEIILPSNALDSATETKHRRPSNISVQTQREFPKRTSCQPSSKNNSVTYLKNPTLPIGSSVSQRLLSTFSSIPVYNDSSCVLHTGMEVKETRPVAEPGQRKSKDHKGLDLSQDTFSERPMEGKVVCETYASRQTPSNGEKVTDTQDMGQLIESGTDGMSRQNSDGSRSSCIKFHPVVIEHHTNMGPTISLLKADSTSALREVKVQDGTGAQNVARSLSFPGLTAEDGGTQDSGLETTASASAAPTIRKTSTQSSLSATYTRATHEVRDVPDNHNHAGEKSSSDENGEYFFVTLDIPKKKDTIIEDDAELLYRLEALYHYQEFVMGEREFKKEILKRTKSELQRELEDELDLLKASLEAAQGYYDDPNDETPRWKKFMRTIMPKHPRSLHRKKSHRSFTHFESDIRKKSSAYTPWFIYFMSLVQLVALIVTCCLGRFTNIALEPDVVFQRGVRTFRGLETVEHWLVPNIWIGPKATFLIRIGALYAPCMREDFIINMEYTKKGYDPHTKLGCCEMATRHVAGTTTEEQCQNYTLGVGFWREGIPCSHRHWTVGHVPHNLKPCCFSMKGQCSLTTPEHCIFLEGSYFDDGPEDCGQVNCLSNLCGMGGLKSDPKYPYKPATPNQYWRLLFGLLHHQGILHFVLVFTIYMLVGRSIESMAGTLRIIIIYMTSGVMSLVAGAVFSPYTPHCGAGGAAFGLVGILLVELIQSWKLVKRPLVELCVLCLVCALFLVSGTLPFVDNFELMTGFLFAILMGVVFLPYITFGKWHARRKRIIIIVTLPVTMLLAAMLFYLFYNIQTVSEICGICKVMNCVPYTQRMCSASDLW